MTVDHKVEKLLKKSVDDKNSLNFPNNFDEKDFNISLTLFITSLGISYNNKSLIFRYIS